MNNQKARLLAGASLLTLAGCQTVPEAVVFDMRGEPSFDGLLPLENTMMNRVWAREDLDLRHYTRFMSESAGFSYRPVRGTTRTRTRGTRQEFPLTDAQKERLERVVNEEFERALGNVTVLERTDQKGPDVLIVRGGLMDIVSRIPPDQPGRSDFWLDSVGQATLVLEFIDSMSGTVLIRAIDTRAASSPGVTQRATTPTNLNEARRLAARWADQLATGLNTITQIPVLRD